MSSVATAPPAAPPEAVALSAVSADAGTTYKDVAAAKPVRLSWADMTEEDDSLRAWMIATAVRSDHRLRVPTLKGSGAAFSVLESVCKKIHEKMDISSEPGPVIEFVPLDALAEAKWFFGLVSALQGLRKDSYGKPANDFDHGEKVGLVAIVSKSEKDREGIKYMLPENRLAAILAEKAKKLLMPSTEAKVLITWIDALVSQSATSFRAADAKTRERAINAIEVTSRVSAMKHAPTVVETKTIGRGKDATIQTTVRVVNPLPSTSEAQGVLSAAESAALAPLGAAFQVQVFPEVEGHRLEDWKIIKACYDVVATHGAAIRRVVKDRRTQVFTHLRTKNPRKDYKPTADEFRAAANELKISERGGLEAAIDALKVLESWTKVRESLLRDKK